MGLGGGVRVGWVGGGVMRGGVGCSKEQRLH